MSANWKRMAPLAVALLAAAPVNAGSDAIFFDSFETPPMFGATTPTLDVPAATVETRCYYFRTPPTPQAVRRITSVAGAGVAHLIVYATYDNGWVPFERRPPGTVQNDCSLAGTVGWLHVAHAPTAETVTPSDDGTGRRVALPLVGDQPLVLQMRLVNASNDPVQTQVDLMFESWHTGAATTPSASYVTYNNSLSIPPGAGSDVESRACAVPTAVDFWRITARTHQLGTRLRVLDGTSTVLLDGNDWERPPVIEFGAPPFYDFASQLTYECTYFNPTGRTVTAGESEETDEVCMAIGWFFPATRPMLCVGNVGPL